MRDFKAFLGQDVCPLTLPGHQHFHTCMHSPSCSSGQGLLHRDAHACGHTAA